MPESSVELAMHSPSFKTEWSLLTLYISKIAWYKCTMFYREVLWNIGPSFAVLWLLCVQLQNKYQNKQPLVIRQLFYSRYTMAKYNPNRARKVTLSTVYQLLE